MGLAQHLFLNHKISLQLGIILGHELLDLLTEIADYKDILDVLRIGEGIEQVQDVIQDGAPGNTD
jgi:hypothetical protein